MRWGEGNLRWVRPLKFVYCALFENEKSCEIIDLKLKDMYDYVLTQYCHPIARHIWGLEGTSWTRATSEDFIARYKDTDQSALDIHLSLIHI